MINSGLNVPNPAIPIPDLAVPNAAPIAEYHIQYFAPIISARHTAEDHLREPQARQRDLGWMILNKTNRGGNSCKPKERSVWRTQVCRHFDAMDLKGFASPIFTNLLVGYNVWQC